MEHTELSPVAVIVAAQLGRGPHRITVAQLSAAVRIPLATVQSAVAELVAAGRVRVAADGRLFLLPPSTIDLTAPAPPAGSAQRHERNRQRWRIEDLFSREPPTREGSVVPIHGMAATVARITASFRSKPAEVLALSPPPAVAAVPALVAPARTANFEMLAAGTRSVWVLDESRLAAPSWRSHIDQLQRAGEEVYAAPDVSQRLIILDRSIAYVPLDPADHTRGSMLIDSAPLVANLVALFHEVLDRASPVSAVRTLSQVRHAILSMLAVGSKDEAIARKLEVSTRTVRRVVAALMAECGAENRFQLAVAAVRLGWLTAEDLARGPVAPVNDEPGTE